MASVGHFRVGDTLSFFTFITIIATAKASGEKMVIITDKNVTKTTVKPFATKLSNTVQEYSTTSIVPTTTPITCGYCATKYVGGSTPFYNVPIVSQNVSLYASCSRTTRCNTVITVPRGYYILLVLDFYMVPGDKLSVYDGDVSSNNSQSPLAVYGTDESGSTQLDSNGNQLTITFEFRFYGGHYPQSYYNARYNAMKADCLCHDPSTSQVGVVKIQSPNYPHYYCPQSQCAYVVNISNRDASSYCSKKPVLGITLSFSAFDLHEQDFVEVYACDNGLIGEWIIVRYFGGMKATSISLDITPMKIVFFGKTGQTYTGFKASVKVDCGPSASTDILSSDTVQLTMGTFAAIGLCFVAILVVLIVALVAVRENRRWRRARASQIERDFIESRGNDPLDLPISAISPLPSYNDALHCLKWEPSVTVTTACSSRQNSVNDGATFPTAPRESLVSGNSAVMLPQRDPPPYSTPNSFRVEINALRRQQSEPIPRSHDIGGHDNQGFNNDETPNIAPSADRVRHTRTGWEDVSLYA